MQLPARLAQHAPRALQQGEEFLAYGPAKYRDRDLPSARSGFYLLSAHRLYICRSSGTSGVNLDDVSAPQHRETWRAGSLTFTLPNGDWVEFSGGKKSIRGLRDGVAQVQEARRGT